MPSDRSDTIFRCRQCGECCRGYGGTFVSPEDIDRISGFIRCDSGSFVDEYCELSGGKPILARGADGRCVFWDKLCTIHPVKPRMCRAWPFIESVLVDVRNWHIMASCCPGMRTDVPDEVILETVRASLSMT